MFPFPFLNLFMWIVFLLFFLAAVQTRFFLLFYALPLLNERRDFSCFGRKKRRAYLGRLEKENNVYDTSRLLGAFLRSSETYRVFFGGHNSSNVLAISGFLILKCYYDQKIIFFFSSDFESVKPLIDKLIYSHYLSAKQ